MKTLNKTSAGLALAAALATVSAPAVAGGLSQPVMEPVVEAPAPAPVMVRTTGDWTGAHIGAQLGYGDAKYGTSNSGEVYGLRGGYDYDFGNWVLGGNIDWNKANSDFGSAGKLDALTRVGVRAGADLGKTLVYATGGWAQAKVKTAAGNLTDDGYFGGVGVDYALNDNWTVGGEILGHRFKDFKNTGTSLNATTAGVNVGFRF